MRQRGRYILAALAVLILGLLTRPAGRVFPHEITSDIGDALWSTFVYLLLTVIFAGWSRRRFFWVTLIFSFCIEFSQMYHAPWIDAIRHNTLGGLILGSGFDWGDLLCYLVGTSIASILDRALGTESTAK